MNARMFATALQHLADERTQLSENAYTESDYETGNFHRGAAQAYQTAHDAMTLALKEEESNA